jgi:hypothetical protein
MFEGYREEDLLAYVEDELDDEARRTLRERLADDPATLARLDRLRADRALLTAADDPALPLDFVTDLEPQLVRPMLIETAPGQTPGAYRRRHRAAGRRGRGLRYALAAGLLVAAGAGVWGIVVVAWPSGTGGPDRTARNDAAPPDGGTGLDGAAATDGARLAGGPGAGDASAADDAAWPDRAIVHHRGPLAPADAGRSRLASAAVAPGDGPRVTAPFALVLDGDVESAETRLAAALTGADASPAATALVRNFSMDEARRLERRFPAPGGPAAPVYADVDGGAAAPGDDPTARERERLARLLAELRRRARAASDDEYLPSGPLLGSEAIAPGYGDQLDLSDHGATHTITIPADDLSAFLGRLHHADGAPVALRPFPASGESDAADGWNVERRLVRDLLARLREAGDGAVVILPVTIAGEAG